MLICNRIFDLVHRYTANHPVLQAVDYIFIILECLHLDSPQGTTVILINNDILGDIHQSTGQITRIRRFKGGISKPLTGTWIRDKVRSEERRVGKEGRAERVRRGRSAR